MFPKFGEKKETILIVEGGEVTQPASRNNKLFKIASLIIIFLLILKQAIILHMLNKARQIERFDEFERSYSFSPQFKEVIDEIVAKIGVAKFQEYQNNFENFLKREEKIYSIDKKIEKINVFINNLEKFIGWEEKYNRSVSFGITPFADFSRAEKQQMAKLLETPTNSTLLARREQNLPLEKGTVDWLAEGKISHVKNQKDCGSCWAFATVAAIEAQARIKRNLEILLSEQELIDCDTSNSGCNGGSPLKAMEYIKEEGLSMVSEESYLYSPQVDKCRNKNKTSKFFISNFYQLDYKDEDSIANWIATNGPATFSMNVVEEFFHYKEGIFNLDEHTCEEESIGRHAMTIVGYGTEKGQDYWLVKNSWGENWGINGYLKLAKGVNACSMAENAIAPII